jgi:prepilin peptidase CpaA
MNITGWCALLLGSAAIVEDLWRGTVSNRLTMAGLTAGLVVACANSGWRGLGSAVAGAVLGFAVFLAFYWRGGMGGGDVKLMAAFGAMLGPSGILMAALLAAIAGALLAAAMLLVRPRAATIPYAPAIVAGVWMAWLGQG